MNPFRFIYTIFTLSNIFCDSKIEFNFLVSKFLKHHKPFLNLVQEIKEKANELDQETREVKPNVKGVDYGPGTDHDHPMDPETGAHDPTHDEL